MRDSMRLVSLRTPLHTNANHRHPLYTSLPVYTTLAMHSCWEHVVKYRGRRRFYQVTGNYGYLDRALTVIKILFVGWKPRLWKKTSFTVWSALVGVVWCHVLLQERENILGIVVRCRVNLERKSNKWHPRIFSILYNFVVYITSNHFIEI